MPNGDCDCASSIPFRHLDMNGHVPACHNWTWEMLWQERLAHNLAVAAALCRSFTLGGKYADDLWDVDMHGRLWRPGCGRSAL
jgi:hypothetical protein